MLTRTTTALLYTRQVRHSGVKLSASNFIQKELRENPEFFNAFPHLAARKGEQAQIETPKPTNFQDPNRESPYFKSLLH